MTRYAIYFVPSADTALWRFGSAAVGYDSQRAAAVPFHDHRFYQNADVGAWTADPRRYGFHGTLKPPFALADGTSIEGLEAAAAEFAAGRSPFIVERLVVKAIGSFVALVPEQASAPLAALAGDCVTAFEPFRAPLTEADRARRLQSPLTSRQIAHLDAWGYPYIFDEFRFHMTLTGRLPDDVRTAAIAALRELYAPIDAPLAFDAISICEQADRDAAFRLRRRFDFSA